MEHQSRTPHPAAVSRSAADVPRRANRTGLPAQLKAGVEQLAGISLDHVRVHRNSDKPAQLNAHAYAQGHDIHLAPGQERHLPHETWHVVQQMQGRVAPTGQFAGAAVNDSPTLEKEADTMGARAVRATADVARSVTQRISKASGERIVQRVLDGGQLAALEAWCKAQEVPLAARDFGQIRDAASSLEEAKQLALDLASRSAAAKRIKLLEGHAGRARKALGAEDSRENAERLQIIEDQIADLTRGGIGHALPTAIASLAELLMDQYPPGNYSYIMMGNSPAPLLAWMQLNGRHAAAFHLPLGGLTSPGGSQRMQTVGAVGVQTKVSNYLDTALGLAVARRKPLVLIDYVSTGGSLVVAAGFIKEWLRSRGIDLPVFIFGYSEKGPGELHELMSAGHAGILATALGRMEKVFTKMNADKAFKNVLLLKGPASLDIEDLLAADDPATAVVQHPDHWARVIRLMRDSMLYDE